MVDKGFSWALGMKAGNRAHVYTPQIFEQPIRGQPTLFAEPLSLLSSSVSRSLKNSWPSCTHASEASCLMLRVSQPAR